MHKDQNPEKRILNSTLGTWAFAASFALVSSLALQKPAYADCAAAPLATASDMVISMKTAHGVQVAPGDKLASTVKEGMVVYDDANNELKLCDGTNWISVGSGGGATASGTAGYIQFSDGTNLANSGTTAGQQFFWDNTNKRLGIGTATPTKALHVVGQSLFTDTLLVQQNGATTGSHTYLSMSNPSTTTNTRSIFTMWGGTNEFRIDAEHGTQTNIRNVTALPMLFSTNAVERMRIGGTGGVSIGSSANPHASSILDVTSTTQGFLPPRMTTAQRTAISSPATGLVVYDTDLNSIYVKTASAWVAVSGSGGNILGTRANLALGTVYGPAPTDGLVIVQGRQDGAVGSMILSVNADGSNPPTTEVASQYSHNNGSNYLGSVFITAPVKQGEYYRILCNGATTCGGSNFVGTPKYQFIPLTGGSGGGGGSTTLAALTDVNVGTPTSGQALVYNTGTSKWIPTTLTAASLNMAPTITISGGNNQQLTLANNAALYVGDGRGSFGNYGTLPSYLVGTVGNDAVNGSANFTLTISGGGALCYLIRHPAWNAVSLTGWSLKASNITFGFSSAIDVYQRILPSGSYSLNNMSALYACDTNVVGGGGGSGTPAADSLNFTEFADAMILDASTDIAADGSEVFSLTNTGTAASFVVNDDASDASPFLINAAGDVVVGGTTVDASAALEVKSSAKGFLPPRMTTAQRNAISSPATGLVVYDTDLNSLYIKTASAWAAVGSDAAGTVEWLHANNSAAQNDIAGNTALALNTIVSSNGSNISLNTGTYRFTLKGGKTYRLEGQARLYGAASTGSVDYRWYNVTGSTFIGTLGDAASPRRSDDWSSMGTAVAYIAPGADTTVELRTEAVDAGMDIASAIAWIEVLNAGGSGGGSTTLAALTDVNVGTPTDGQALTWNNGTSKWVPTTLTANSGAQVAFRVHKNGTAQSVTNGTPTKLTWSTETFDTNNNFASDKFTPTVAGKYLVTGSLGCGSLAGQYCVVQIRKNGSTVLTYNYTYASPDTAPSTTTVVDMNGTTDYLELYTITGTGGTITGDPAVTNFSGFLINGGSGGSSTAAGSDKQLQFNDGGSTFAGTTKLIWDKTAESLAIGTTSSAVASSLVELSSTTKGFLPPRMTTAQRTAISSPATGLVVYDTDLNSLYIKTASAWAAVGANSSAVTFQAVVSSSQIVPTATWTKVNFGVETFDSNNNFATSRFTPTTAGTYLLHALVGTDDTPGALYVAIYKNGAAVIGGERYAITGGTYNYPSVTGLVTANGTSDYFEIYVISDKGSNLTLQNDSRVRFEGFLIGGGSGGGGGSTTLAALTDVNVGTPTDGQALTWNNGTSKWVPTTLAANSSSQVAFSVHKNGTNQTVSGNVETLLTWSTERFDTNNNFASDRFTPTVAGKYLVTLQIRCNAATVECRASLRKNGTEYATAVQDDDGGGMSSVVTAVVDMNGSSDYIEAYGNNNSNTTIYGDARFTHFQGFLIGGGSSGGSTTLAALTDVNVGTPTDGQALTWNNGTSKWVPTTLADGSTAQVAFFGHRNGTATGANTNGVWTKLNWTHESFDTNNNFVPGSGGTQSRFTPTVAGKYLVTVSNSCDNAVGTSHYCGASVYKNGVNINWSRNMANTGARGPASVTVLVDMNGSGDYLEAFGETSVNGAAFEGSPTTNYFSAFLISGGGGGSASASGAAGTIQFAGASNVFAGDASNFFWDDTNNRLGVGTATPAQALDVVGTATANKINLKSVTGAAAPTGPLGTAPQIMVVQDQKADGTNGGSSSVGTQTRVLNTVQYNSITGASLASNMVTLPAGVYRIHAKAPTYLASAHQIRLYNVTGSATLAMGTSQYSAATVVANDSTLDAVITLGATSQLRIDHDIQTAKATDGLGVHAGASFGVEVYTTMTIEKLQ